MQARWQKRIPKKKGVCVCVFIMRVNTVIVFPRAAALRTTVHFYKKLQAPMHVHKSTRSAESHFTKLPMLHCFTASSTGSPLECCTIQQATLKGIHPLQVPSVTLFFFSCAALSCTDSKTNISEQISNTWVPNNYRSLLLLFLPLNHGSTMRCAPQAQQLENSEKQCGRTTKLAKATGKEPTSTL